MLKTGTLTNEQRIRLYSRFFIRIALFSVFMLLAVYAGPLLLYLFMPFILAFIVASLLNPAVCRLNAKLGIPRRLLSLVLVFAVFFGFSILMAWFVRSLGRESASFAQNIRSVTDYINISRGLLAQKLKLFIDILPGDTEAILADFLETVIVWLHAASKGLADNVFSNTIKITTKVGSGIVSTIIFIMSAYFITADYPELEAFVERFKSTRLYSYLKVVKQAAQLALGGYIKAQLLLALFAFVVMFVGFFLYGQPYAFLLAFILAIVDFLPFIGTSAVLVPWSIVSFIGGDPGKGTFLLVLSAVFFICRRLAEPKVMSEQTGMSPLLTLISIYLGMKISGLWGMLIGPVIAMVVIGVVKAGTLESSVKDAKAVFADVGNFLKRED